MGSMSSDPDDSDSLVGQVLAGYHIERELGRGGASVVFLAERLPETLALVEQTRLPVRELPDQVAIKALFPPAVLTSGERKDLRARFLREAQTLQAVSHPNIVKIVASGEDEATGLAYIILPFMAGGTLAEWLARQGEQLPLDEAARLIAQIAAALDYLHTLPHPVVHRDVKPGNILLDGQGRAYLGDFGIIRLLDTLSATLTTTGQILGTIAYMAPEQLTGDSVGPPADIYSLGSVLYEMVTGRPAFVVRGLPPPPRQLRPDLPEPADAVIQKALASKPADRFSSAGEFATAFAQALTGLWPAGLIPQTQEAVDFSRTAIETKFPANTPWPSRHRGHGRAIALGIFSALLVVGALGILFAKALIPNELTPTTAQVAPTATATHRSGFITVSALMKWQNSGVLANAGDRVSIIYISGQWSYSPGTPLSDGNGPPQQFVCAQHMPMDHCGGWPDPYAVSGSLIGQIGSQVLAVGDSLDTIAQQSGDVLLAINDGDDFDNTGSLVVEVVIN